MLISQVYDPADPHIDSDVQFGVTRALIGDFVRHDEPHPTASDAGSPWYSLDYVYRMEAGRGGTAAAADQVGARNDAAPRRIIPLVVAGLDPAIYPSSKNGSYED